MAEVTRVELRDTLHRTQAPYDPIGAGVEDQSKQGSIGCQMRLQKFDVIFRLAARVRCLRLTLQASPKNRR
jgi:hypothetical protein